MRFKKWWFAPLYGGVIGSPDTIAAEDLVDAFKEARRSWPTARGWRCLGRVNQRDSEKSTEVDAGIEERVVRVEPSQANAENADGDAVEVIFVDEITSAARKVLELHGAEVSFTRRKLAVWFPTDTTFYNSFVMPGEEHVLARDTEQGGRKVLRVLSPPDLERVVRVEPSHDGLPGSIGIQSGVLVVNDITPAARKVLELYKAEVQVSVASSLLDLSGLSCPQDLLQRTVMRVRIPNGTVAASQANIEGASYIGVALKMPGEEHGLACEMVKEGSPAVLRVIYPPELEQTK